MFADCDPFCAEDECRINHNSQTLSTTCKSCLKGYYMRDESCTSKPILVAIYLLKCTWKLKAKLWLILFERMCPQRRTLQLGQRHTCQRPLHW